MINSLGKYHTFNFKLYSYIIICILFHLFFVFYSVNQNTDFRSIGELYIFLHKGSMNLRDIMGTLTWITPFILLMYYLGVSLNQQVFDRSEYLFLRTSRSKWWWSHFLFILFISFLSIMIEFMSICMFVLLFTDIDNLFENPILLILNTARTFLSLVAMLNLYTLLSLLIKNRMALVVLSSYLFMISSLSKEPFSLFFLGKFSMLKFDDQSFLFAQLLIEFSYLVIISLLCVIYITKKNFYPERFE